MFLSLPLSFVKLMLYWLSGKLKTLKSTLALQKLVQTIKARYDRSFTSTAHTTLRFYGKFMVISFTMIDKPSKHPLLKCLASTLTFL